MKSIFLLSFILCASTWANPEKIARGRHIVTIAGCNDCHTHKFGEKNGDVPETEWLTGSPVGFKGPWGISYPANLRTLVKTFKEKPFIAHVRSKKYLPPMPGYALKEMSDEELSSIYAYLTHLGPAGEKMPMNLPPGGTTKGLYYNFVPVAD